MIRFLSNIKALGVAFALPFCLASCLSGYEVVAADVSPAGWSEPVTLLYSNTDTLTLKDVSLTLRHSVEVSPLESGFLIETVSPSKAGSYSNLRMKFSSPVSGNNLYETSVSLRTGMLFSESGDYVFTVTPMQEVSGVWSIAIDFK